jgi:hypothetical protein
MELKMMEQHINQLKTIQPEDYNAQQIIKSETVLSFSSAVI